jgi:hypothetical protein
MADIVKDLREMAKAHSEKVPVHPSYLTDAADEIELLRRLLGESSRREGDANNHVARLQHRISQLSN